MSATTMGIVEQRNAALERANEKRIAHANIKRWIAAKPATEARPVVAEMLRNPTGNVPTIRIGPLLQSINKVGVTKVEKWLKAADVMSSNRMVIQLTDRQRNILADLIEEQAA